MAALYKALTGKENLKLFFYTAAGCVKLPAGGEAAIAAGPAALKPAF